jgi:hypothetical protein
MCGRNYSVNDLVENTLLGRVRLVHTTRLRQVDITEAVLIHAPRSGEASNLQLHAMKLVGMHSHSYRSIHRINCHQYGPRSMIFEGGPRDCCGVPWHSPSSSPSLTSGGVSTVVCAPCCADLGTYAALRPGCARREPTALVPCFPAQLAILVEAHLPEGYRGEPISAERGHRQSGQPLICTFDQRRSTYECG